MAVGLASALAPSGLTRYETGINPPQQEIPMSERTCQFEEEIAFAKFPSLWSPRTERSAPPPSPAAGHEDARVRRTMGRRGFLQRAAVATGALTAADFLRYFFQNGIPADSRAYAMASRASEVAGEP